MSRLFDKKLPLWEAAGEQADGNVTTGGWQILDQPPAAWLNHFYHTAYLCLSEIYDFLEEHGRESIRWLAYGKAKSTSVETHFHLFTDDETVEYCEGQLLYITMSVNNKAGVYLALNGGGCYYELVNTDGAALKENVLVAGATYAAVGMNGKYVLIDNIRSFDEIRAVDISDCFGIRQEGYYIVSDGITRNTPFDVGRFLFAQGNYFLEVRRLNDNIVWQRILSLSAYDYFSVIIDLESGCVGGWQREPKSDAEAFTFFGDLFTENCGKGFEYSSEGLNFTIGAGRLYSESYGGIRMDAVQVLSLPRNVLSYIYMSSSGTCEATSVWDGAGALLYKVQTNATGITLVTKMFGSLELISGVRGVTQNVGTANKTLATTEFVKSSIENARFDISQIKNIKFNKQWTSIKNKPSVFQPDMHRHKNTEINGNIVLSVNNIKPTADGSIVFTRYYSRYYDGNTSCAVISVPENSLGIRAGVALANVAKGQWLYASASVLLQSKKDQMIMVEPSTSVLIEGNFNIIAPRGAAVAITIYDYNS